MAVVNFNFTRILAERTSQLEGKINIRNNVSIKDVTRSELDFGSTKQPVLKFIFEFTSDYDPKVGHITLNGEVVYMENEKKVQDILKEWKKDKRISKDIMANIINNVLAKCNIQALIISKDVNLPPPIPLPKLQPDQNI
ncbi:MAG: hypothetical protein V1837_02110 [Candidatus Woesearchaeota archaeon]